MIDKTPKEREEFITFIKYFENKYAVDNWVISNIHVWPYLRIMMYLKLQRGQAITKNNNKKSWHKLLKTKIKVSISYFKGLILKNNKLREVDNWIISLPKRSNIFLGANAHRVNYFNKSFNRFFDSLILNKNISTEDYLFFEYGNIIEGNDYYNSENVERYAEYLLKFKKSTTHKNHESIQEFELFFEEINHNSFLSFLIPFNSPNNFYQWFNQNVVKEVLFFKKLLQQVKPEKIYTLCYYTTEIMNFTAAANSLGIETLEMQHGPQTDSHLAYGSWHKIPKSGYLSLPRTFLNWDEYSQKTINKWALTSNVYKAIVFGHPWFDKLIQAKNNFKHSKHILISLQPYPSNYKLIFSDRLIFFLNHQELPVIIRIHPRQSNQNEILEFITSLKLKNVSVHNSRNIHLPEILATTVMHVTQFSGVTIEANHMNVRTVLLDPAGKEFYKELIYLKQVIYIDPMDNQLSNKISEFLFERNKI